VPCKNDQLGENFVDIIGYCTATSVKTLHGASPASSSTLESSHTRDKTFLFPTCTESRKPITPSEFDSTHKALFKRAVGKERASLIYSHSGRIEIACRLLAAGASTPQILSLLHWRSEDSLKAYARLNPRAYEDLGGPYPPRLRTERGLGLSRQPPADRRLRILVAAGLASDENEAASAAPA